MSELASELYPNHPSPMPKFRFLGGDAGQGLLASALAQPAQTFGGVFLYRTMPDKAAALLISMIKNLPFVDGNKRIALTTTIVFLNFNGWLFHADCDDGVAECLRIARTEGNVEFKKVASWIRKRSIRVERALQMSESELAQWSGIIERGSDQFRRLSQAIDEMRSLRQS